MHEQRRLDLALLTDDGLVELLEAVSFKIRNARDTGVDVAPDLLDLQVDLLVERSCRIQEYKRQS
jgi:hypothetical protein